MIKTKNLLPSVYNDKSRDFQLLSHLWDLIFNYNKTIIDTTTNVMGSPNFNKVFLDLLATTLGFYSIHNYNDTDLFKLCSALKYIIKNKGSMKALETSVNILLNAYGLESANIETIRYVMNGSNKEYVYSLVITLPRETSDLILLRDLLDYILPTGWVYSLQLAKYETQEAETLLTTNDKVSITEYYNEGQELNTLASQVEDDSLDMNYGRLNVAEVMTTPTNMTRLDTPTEIKVVNNELTWNNVENATSYNIYIEIPNQQPKNQTLDITAISSDSVDLEIKSIFLLDKIKNAPQGALSYDLSTYLSNHPSTSIIIGVMACGDNVLNSKVKFISYKEEN